MKGLEHMPERSAKRRLNALIGSIEIKGNEALAIFNEWSPSINDIDEASIAFNTLLNLLKSIVKPKPPKGGTSQVSISDIDGIADGTEEI